MKRIILVSFLTLLSAFCVNAQNVSDLIISEVLAVPDSTGRTDDYGQRNGWIEIFNTSQGTVNFGGCYLTDDRGNLTKSLIPKGDLRTKLGPRQTALFYASGNGRQGTFYTDFKVEAGRTIYLVSNDGRTIIDSLAIPQTLPEGKSISKVANDNKEMDFQALSTPTDPTPGMPNGEQNAETKSQKMARQDPHGCVLTLVSVTVVFAALAILWFLFNLLFKNRKDKKKVTKASSGVTPEIAAAITMAIDMENSGEEYAAIATALHLYLNDGVHDKESFVLTIRPNENSGWKDKSLTFRRNPRK